MFTLFDYEGLIEKESRGRKPRLKKDYEEKFKETLESLQATKGGGQIIAEDIQ